jgi:hypothetical protein
MSYSIFRQHFVQTKMCFLDFKKEGDVNRESERDGMWLTSGKCAFSTGVQDPPQARFTEINFKRSI